MACLVIAISAAGTGLGSSGASGIAQSVERLATGEEAASSNLVSRSAPDSCKQLRKAVRYYRAAYVGWRSKVGAGEAVSRRKAAGLLSCPRYLSKLMRSKARAARVEYRRWRVYHYAWWKWLPDKWRRVAVCETGLNWHHANGSYISAFGISRDAYNEDARVYDAPPWSDRKYPTPHEQYLAALGHYYLHGGFSGWGCRGA